MLQKYFGEIQMEMGHFAPDLSLEPSAGQVASWTILQRWVFFVRGLNKVVAVAGRVLTRSDTNFIRRVSARGAASLVPTSGV